MLKLFRRASPFVWRTPALLGLALMSTLSLVDASASGLQPIGQTRTSSEGQVTLTATLTGIADELEFAIVMDTHVVDLDVYDLRTLALLRTDAGVEVAPVRWEAPAGGHHREGTLWFPALTADGTPTIGPDASTMTLVIRDVAGISEQSLHWAL